MFVLVFLATVLICFSVQFLLKRRKLYQFADNIPSPPCYGILGHAPYFLGKTDAGAEILLYNLLIIISIKFIPIEKSKQHRKSRNFFRSPGDASSVMLGISNVYQTVPRSSDHVAACKRSKIDTKSFIIAFVSGETVLLQISETRKWTNFGKM